MLGVVLVLGGCGESSDTVATSQFLERAQKFRAEGKLRASVIELKNALQKDPKSGAARLMLGEIYLLLGNGPAAEKEISRAQSLGINQDKVTVPLGRAWLLQGQRKKVLEKAKLSESASPAQKAALLILQGNAHRGLRARDKAEAAFKQAAALDPKNPESLVGLARLALSESKVDEAAAAVERAAKVAPDNFNVIALTGDIAFIRGKYADAEDAYRKLVAARRDFLGSLLPLAHAQIARGEIDAALKNIARVLKVAPKHLGANYLRALAAYQKKDFPNAKTYSEQVLAVAPNHLPSQLVAGGANFALGNYEQAAKYLTSYLDKRPTNALARRLLGAALLKANRAGAALKTLSPLIDESSNDAALLGLLGTAAVRSGNFKAGREYLAKVAAMNPDDATARARLGVVRIGTGEVEEGIKELEKAIKLNPKFDRAIFALYTAHMRTRQFDKALADAKKIEANQPKKHFGASLIGIALYAKGDKKGARAAFTRALKIKPGAPDASLNLAIIEVRDKHSEKAQALLKEALRLNPKHLSTMLRLALLDMSLRQWDAARTLLEQAVTAHPDAVPPRVTLGRLLLARGEAVKALGVLQPALQKNPKNAGLLAVTGMAQIAMGETEDAAVSFRRLIEQRPKAALGHYLLAKTYQGAKDKRRYREQLERVLALEPAHLASKLDLIALDAAESNFGKANKLLAELKKTAPDNPVVITADGILNLLQRRYTEAIALFQKALAKAPNSNVLVQLAVAYWRDGQRDKSLETLEDWVQKYPKDQRVRFVLANRYLTLNKLPEAKTSFAKVVEAAPKNWPALNNLAWVLLTMGDAKGALPHAERALMLSKNRPSVMDTAGLILLKLGENDRAVKLLRGASEKVPKNPEIKFHFARALVGAGNKDEARRVLKAILAESPAFSERPKAESLLKELGDS